MNTTNSSDTPSSIETTKTAADVTGEVSDGKNAKDAAVDKLERLAEKVKRSSTAAKLSGAFHEQTGKLKQKIGEFRDDPALEASGQKQELLGKVHRLVGEVREIREIGLRKLINRRADVYALLRDHAGKFLDGGAAFLDDVKKKLL